MLFTMPFVPLVWMGEEFAASTPWPFFTSFKDKTTGEASSQGRARDFVKAGWPTMGLHPQDPATFTMAKLNWNEVHRQPHVNNASVTNYLPDGPIDFDEAHRWLTFWRGSTICVVVNFSKRNQEVPIKRGKVSGTLLFATEDRGIKLLQSSIYLLAESAAVVRYDIDEVKL